MRWDWIDLDISRQDKVLSILHFTVLIMMRKHMVLMLYNRDDGDDAGIDADGDLDDDDDADADDDDVDFEDATRRDDLD